MSSDNPGTPSAEKTFAWWWQIWRDYKRQTRDMAVRHARERAALTAWRIEVEHVVNGN